MQYIRNLLVRQLLWMAQSKSVNILAPADADPTQLGMEGMSARLFSTELFMGPNEEGDYRQDVTAPLWHPVSGTLERAGDTCRILPVDGSQPMRIHPRCCCRMKDRGSDTSVVLLYDRKNPGTGDQILVTEAEYRLADPFPSVYDKAYMLLEYLRLDQPKQEMVFSFLTDEDCSEDTFDDMCRLALEACQSGSDMSAVPKVVWNDPEEGRFLELLGFFSEYMENDLWILCILLAVRKLVCMFEEVEACFVLDELIRADACCHHPALSECVERILPKWEADNFARLLLSADPEDVDEFAFARVRFWLFALLEARIPLSRSVLQEICRRHFCYPMTARVLRSLRSSLFSSNAEVLRECIEAMYPEKYALPNSGLPAALAVIRIHDKKYLPIPIQEEAQKLLLKGTGEADVLLGIAMMTVYLQFRSEHIRSHREPVVLSREAEVTARVLKWLQDPGGIYYPHVCELAYWLYLSCAVPEDAFADPQVIHSASIAWNERIYPARVEKLVSTLPMGMTLPQSDALGRMRRVLQKRFDSAMRGKNTAEKIIPLFRCCAVLGCWEKVYLQYRFKFLLQKIDHDSEYTSGENREYMRRLEWEMLAVMVGSRAEGDDANAWFLQENSLLLSKPKNTASLVVSDKAQAVSLLHSFRRTLCRKTLNLDSIADLFQCSKLDIQEPCLITDWFYALCTMGLSVEAQEFYLNHKDVLDRPWIYLPDSTELSVERPYHAASCFWNGQTRWEKGLELAVGMGHTVEQWSLAQRYEHGIYRKQQYVPKSGPDRKKVLRFFQVQHSPGKKRMMNYWMTHYDDSCATRMALAEPENHSTILLFGYCGSKEMVLAALEADPSHVCYASKALLKDDQVALTVLKQSCRYLYLLFAPVTENQEYIKNLILMQEEPVVLNRTKDWVRDDKELMLPSVEAYPQYFERVSERLRRDREVVLAALKGAIRQTEGSFWLRHILQYTPPELWEDPEIIQYMRKRCSDFGEQKETDFAFDGE